MTCRSTTYSEDDLKGLLDDIVNSEAETMFDYHLECQACARR